MDLTASYVFDAPVDRTWNLLMDVAAIARCLPGGRELRPVGNDRYEVDLGITIAAIAGDFKGSVALEDKVPPQSFTLVMEGSGRPGFVKGKAHITLTGESDRTRVDINAQAEAGGMIARIGQRLIEGSAKSMMDKFFGCMAKQAAEDGAGG